MILNVRCCCTPTKILGTMPWADGREQLLFARMSPDGVITKHTVRVRHFRHEDGTNELAVYGDDRGLEFWRKVPGFKEGDYVDPRS